MTGSSGEKLVKIRILGQEYTIRSHEEDKVRQVASYLNKQIENIQKNSSALNRTDLVVMAAFKAAGDYIQARDDFRLLQRKVESQAEALASRIDDRLPEPAEG